MTILTICGSYERLLYGLSNEKNNNAVESQSKEGNSEDVKGNSEDVVGNNEDVNQVNKDKPKDQVGDNVKDQENNELNAEFIYPAHISSITTVAATNKYLATGSTDEHVKIYDLQNRKEIGSLMHHEATITCLAWIKNQHLISACDNGIISIIRASDWTLLKTLNGHSKGVSGISIHSCGKLMLSVSKDMSLKCWDLARAICSFTMKLPLVPLKVYFSPDDSQFAIFYDSQIHLHCLSKGSIITRINSKTRVFAKLLNENMIIYGSGLDIHLVRTDGTLFKTIKSGHGFRIKDMYWLKDTSTLVTIGSDGSVFHWDLLQMDAPISNYQTKCRLTCVCVVDSNLKPRQVKQAVVYPESDYEDAPKSKQRVTVTFEDGKNEKTEKLLKAKGKKHGGKIQKFRKKKSVAATA